MEPVADVYPAPNGGTRGTGGGLRGEAGIHRTPRGNERLMTVLTALGADDLIAGFRDRSVSPVEVANEYLRRIDQHNGILNAYLTVTADLALEAARESEARLTAGAELRPLEGIPVALKDNIALAGVRMTAGSPFLANNVPDTDAAVVRRLKEAGAVVLGKLNMHEWALGATGVNPHFGPARNPWDTDRMTGGSSSGAGAALGTDLTVLALGSDTGGSGRIPAALCNVSGLRPTTGRISGAGVVPLAWSFDIVAPMARRASDIARLLSVLSGHDPNDPMSVDVATKQYGEDDLDVADLRVAVLSGFFSEDLESEIGDLVAGVGTTLASLGAHVEPLEIPGIRETLSALTTMLQAEAAAFHAERLATDPTRFGASVAERLRSAGERTAPQYGSARQIGRIWKRRMQEIMRVYDLLLCPTCAVTAPRIGDPNDVAVTRALTRLTYPWSLTGLPSISVPAGLAGGLPVGAQLVGRPWEEATVLRAARAYQDATDRHLRRPDVGDQVTGSE